MKYFFYFFLGIAIIACKTKRENSLIEIEFETKSLDSIHNFQSVFLINKPDLLSGHSNYLFWKRWGLRQYKFKNVKCIDNKITLNSVENGIYTIFLTTEKNEYHYSGRLDSVEIRIGENYIRRVIDFDAIRTYTE